MSLNARITSDGDEDADAELTDERLEVVDDDYDVLIEMSTGYHAVVQKVRKVVKMFKRSPTRNDAKLQPYVKQDFGREVGLLLDSKTRWNSLVDMLSQFLQWSCSEGTDRLGTSVNDK